MTGVRERIVARFDDLSRVSPTLPPSILAILRESLLTGVIDRELLKKALEREGEDRAHKD